MQSITVDQEAALAAAGIVIRDMLLFDLASGYYGFWTGQGIRVWNTIDFLGVGSLIQVSRENENTSLEAGAVVATLRAQPDLGLTANILASIENEAYKNRPVTIYRALLNRTTWAFIDDPIILWKGIIDYFSHDEGADGDYVLTCHMESRAIDYTRRGAAVRSSAQQILVSSGDKGFDFVGVAGTAQIYFGTKVPKSKKKSGWSIAKL